MKAGAARCRSAARPVHRTGVHVAAERAAAGGRSKRRALHRSELRCGCGSRAKGSFRQGRAGRGRRSRLQHADEEEEEEEVDEPQESMLPLTRRRPQVAPARIIAISAAAGTAVTVSMRGRSQDHDYGPRWKTQACPRRFMTTRPPSHALEPQAIALRGVRHDSDAVLVPARSDLLVASARGSGVAPLQPEAEWHPGGIG